MPDYPDSLSGRPDIEALEQQVEVLQRKLAGARLAIAVIRDALAAARARADRLSDELALSEELAARVSA